MAAKLFNVWYSNGQSVELPQIQNDWDVNFMRRDGTFTVPAIPPTPEKDDGFNSDADIDPNVKNHNMDPGDPRDKEATPGTPETSFTMAVYVPFSEFFLHPNDDNYYISVTPHMVPDRSATPTITPTGSYIVSTNDPIGDSQREGDQPYFDLGHAESLLTGMHYGTADKRGWQGDGANGVLVKEATANYSDTPATDSSPEQVTASYQWTEVRLHTNVPPAPGDTISRCFVVVRKVDGAATPR